MRSFKNCLVVGGAVCWLATASLFAQSIDETWQVSITGHDRGVAILTFTNNFTFAGYGISLDALGPFTMTGTWTNSTKGFQGTFTRASDGPTENGLYTAKLNNNGLVMRVTHSTIGPQTFKAPIPALPPTVHNEWFVKGSTGGTKYLESFTLMASTNMPGWFNLSGGGTGGSEAGSFTLTGAVLVTSDLKAAAYTISDYGVVSDQASLVGHLARNGKRLVLVGRDTNGKIVTLHATTNP